MTPNPGITTTWLIPKVATVISRLSLKDILAPAHVHRWHMIRVKRTQTLAEHSFTVALLAMKLESLLDREQGAVAPAWGAELPLALIHDLHETEYGDMPTPAKWFFKATPEGRAMLAGMEDKFWADRGVFDHNDFAPETKHLVKLADMMEAYLFYREEGDDDSITRRLGRDMAAYADTNFPNHARLRAFVHETWHER